ncbi:M10 family metallopeptidase C-terminal domain-containing protein [Nostoc punctiforme UO1]|uniref:calcium-binding protein n=1 Tax=Nostoc punctiforme TaxID=272131 RepID=UPI0030A30291
MSTIAMLSDLLIPNKDLNSYSSTAPNPNPSPNFVTAQSGTIFSNYSYSPSATLTEAQTDTLLKGGVGVAIADAQAVFFSNDPSFSALFTDTSITGLSGQFTGSADSETKVLASFTVDANKSFSFNFSADLVLTAKEIENSKVEYNKAQSKSNFLVLDTTDPNKPIVLDYFGIQGNLISSNKIGNLTLGHSGHVTINTREKSSDIDGNNGSDYLNASAFGTYQRNFTRNTNITIVEINISAVELAGDTLIGNLGKDVIYGTIWNDNLTGTNTADKIYASLGDDKLYGQNGNDYLDAGQGNDLLNSGDGNDSLYGGLGNDVLIGGSGNDVLVGGDGNDTFTFKRDETFLRNDFDTIQGFQVGVDKIVLHDWGYFSTSLWLKLGNITDTQDGAVIKLNSLLSQETILISGVSASQIAPQSIVFT